MKYLSIFWSLLRYRVAVMLVLFMAISLAYHHGLQVLTWRHAVAVLALLCSYVSATSFNDVADEAIDKINHAGKPGRLLVTGEATARQLVAVGLVASAVMLGCGFLLGPAAGATTLVALAVNLAYSLPPLRLSYRTHLVPFVLAIGYVYVPYGLGLSIVQARFGSGDAWLLAALYGLFLARINLKDFRDRDGDAKYGKPTFLLRYGKAATLWASQILLGIGTLLATIVVSRVSPLGLVVVCYAAVISWLLVRLSKTPVGLRELVVIGVAAQVGNGLLISLLAVLLVNGSAIPDWALAVILASVLGGSLANLKFLSQNPRQVLEAYRG